jgi:hypothetical protein
VRKYSKAELLAFLRRLDQRLEEPATFTVIGGAAAVLAYGATKPTGDIDTWGSVPSSVEKAALEILNRGDEFVPIGSAGVADLPYEAEDRFRPAPLGLAKLEVLVPDRYDLALSKTVRGYAHDFDAIEEMHQRRRFSMKKLVQRFERELDGIANTDKRKLRLNVAVLIARLFGKKAGEEVADRWGVTPPRLKT